MDAQFRLLIPITKAEVQEGTGDIRFAGPITSAARDLQNQKVLVSYVKKALNTWVRNGQLIDWNHMSQSDTDPSDPSAQWIIGKGDRLYDAPNDRGEVVPHVQMTVWGDQPIAHEIRRLHKKGIDFYASIGGATFLDEHGVSRPQYINHIALTPYPANLDAKLDMIPQGMQQLAKSLGYHPLGGTEIADNEVEESASLQQMLKTLVAGSGPGYNASGFRGVIGEDLEGDECKCAKECTCNKRKHNDDDPHGDIVKMGKSVQVFDPAFTQELEVVKDSDNQQLSFMAKCFLTLEKTLQKTLTPLFKNKVDQTDDNESPGDTDGTGDEQEDATGDSESMRKSASAIIDSFDESGYYGAPEFTQQEDLLMAPVDSTQFGKSLLAGMDQLLEVRNAPILKTLGGFGTRLAKLEKSFSTQQTSSGDDAELSELRKKLDEIGQGLDAIGQQPRVKQQYSTLTKGAEPLVSNNRQIPVSLAKSALMQGFREGKVTGHEVTMYDAAPELRALSAQAQNYVNTYVQTNRQ